MYDTMCVPPTAEALEKAARLIRDGELVAFPTETVYGLGANALDSEAVAKIFAAKNRPADNPLIVHIWDESQLEPLCYVTDAARALIKAYWPGPLTLLMKKKPTVPDIVTAGLDSVGMRMPSHPAAQAFLKAANLPVAAPSANLSTRPSPTTAAHVMEDMNGRIPMILDGGACEVGVESTVLDVTGTVPVVLRPGAVTPDMIARVAGSVSVAGSVMRPLMEGEHAPSPGMRHKHYAPRGRMTIVRGGEQAVAQTVLRLYNASDNACILALSGHIKDYPGCRVYDLGADDRAVAHNIFSLLRQADDEGIERIIAEGVLSEEVGLAVMNRMARAAAFDIIEV